MAFMWIRSWAQDDEEDDFYGALRPNNDFDSLDGFVDYAPLHITFTDILLVILLLLSCYVFGKIWKGCSYLLIIAAAIFYYLTR